MIKIPKLVLPIDLGDYAPELAGEILNVWVDPPRRMLQEYDALIADVQEKELKRVSADLKTPPQESTPMFQSFLASAKTLLQARKKNIEHAEGTDARILCWYVDIWSQGEHSLTLDEVKRIEEENPAFLGWLIGETWRMIHDNRIRQKKN